jgi:protein-S-isoprenylcysteine O-methyltransferase Ste14
MVHLIFWWIVLGCWGLFAVVWFGGWVYNLMHAPQVERKSLMIPFWIIGLLFVVLVARASLLRTFVPLGALPLWVQALGIAIIIPSTVFTLWARFTLGTMWSSIPEAKVGHQLRTDGPYGVTRHPIYTGMLGMLLGSMLVGGIGLWIVLAILGAFFVLLKIPAEEKLMIETFGDEYRQYRQRVPQLIPGLRLLKRGHFTA